MEERPVYRLARHPSSVGIRPPEENRIALPDSLSFLPRQTDLFILVDEPILCFFDIVPRSQ
jgi:hypothetical protein